MNCKDNNFEYFVKEEIHHTFNKGAEIFVGRKKELAKLDTNLEKAFNGSGSVVLIRGEAGIGKNSLVSQFTKRAIEKGARYVSGKFKPTNSFDPYAPFLEIIQKLSTSNFDMIPIDQHRSDNNGKNKVEKYRNKEFLHKIQNERNLLQQKIVASLSKISQDNPILIDLKDVHLAPLTAWQFIHYLAHTIIDLNILIVMTLRQDGRKSKSNDIPVYADVLQRMNRENLLEVIKLKRFGQNEVRKYINHFFPRRDFSSKFIPLILEISQGLPDQLSNILRIMMYLGIVYKQENIWFNDENIDKENIVYFLSDEHEKEQVKKQIKNLSAQQIRILQYASLLQSSLDYNLLSEILGLSRHKLTKDLSSLKEQKILFEDGDGYFRFKRAIFQSVLSEQVPISRKTEMNKEIVKALEKLDSNGENKRIHLLAYHSSQSGNQTKSFKYLQKAGEYAIHKLAFPEAKEFFEKAIRLIPLVSLKTHNKTIKNVLLEAAWLDRVLGYWVDSLNKCKMAKQLFSTGDINLRNQILIQEGFTYFRLNDWKNSSDCFHTTLLNPKNVSLYDKAMATYGLGNIFFETSQYEESRNYYHQTLKLAEELDSHFLKANIFNNLGAIESVRGNRVKAISLYSQGISLFQDIRDNYGLARLYNNIGMTYAEENNWQKANEFYGKSLSISDQYGLMPMKSITFLNRALALVNLKKFEEAREYNYKAFRLLNRLKEELGLAEYYKIQGIIEREEGNWSEARKNLQIALEKYLQLKNKLGSAETQYELGVLGLANSEPDEMQNWLQRALETYRYLGINDKVKLIENRLKEFQFSNPLSEVAN